MSPSPEIPFNPDLPVVKRDSGWYKTLFDRRWAALRPLEFQDRFSVRRGEVMEDIPLVAKITAATLFEMRNDVGETTGFEVIIGDFLDSAYHYGRHYKMLRDLRVIHDGNTRIEQRYDGHIYETPQRDLNLVLSNLNQDAVVNRAAKQHLAEVDYLKLIIEAFTRYGVKKVYSSDHTISLSGDLEYNIGVVWEGEKYDPSELTTPELIREMDKRLRQRERELDI